MVKKPTILFITPEVTYLPPNMGDVASRYSVKAGGLADVSAGLISEFFDKGIDIHVAIPFYRYLIEEKMRPDLSSSDLYSSLWKPDNRIHLVNDSLFFYTRKVHSAYCEENLKMSLTFQRDIINYFIPQIRPDLIHCNDWMTGLIPSAAREIGIPCLFTLHNIHTAKATLMDIENSGIDVNSISHHFHSHHYHDYRVYLENIEDRSFKNRAIIDLLTTGIFAAHFVNVVSQTFLKEIISHKHSFVDIYTQLELKNKADALCAKGILNAPDPSFNPLSDENLIFQFGPDEHFEGKNKNKLHLQNSLGLIQDIDAPLLLWPSRLDQIQKGCHLLLEIFYNILKKYQTINLQFIFISDGEYQKVFKKVTEYHSLNDRVAICDYDHNLEHLGYAASDFMIMPSYFEPCGLPQMIAPIYGSIPVVHKTGGLNDTITQLDIEKETGNGFVFTEFDSEALSDVIDQAMTFYLLPQEKKSKQITRIMKESIKAFNFSNTSQKYIELYENMLQRPVM